MFLTIFLLLALPSPQQLLRLWESTRGPEFYTALDPTLSSYHSSTVVRVYDRPRAKTFHTVPVGTKVKVVAGQGRWKRVVSKSPIIFSGWVRDSNLVRVVARKTAAFCSPEATSRCAVLTEGMPVRVSGKAKGRIAVIPWGLGLPALRLYVPPRALTSSSRSSGHSNISCLKRPFMFWRGHVSIIRKGRVRLFDSLGHEVRTTLVADSVFIVGPRYMPHTFRIMWGRPGCIMFSGLVSESDINSKARAFVLKYSLMKYARFAYTPVKVIRVMHHLPLFDTWDSVRPWAYVASGAFVSWLEGYSPMLQRARLVIMMKNRSSSYSMIYTVIPSVMSMAAMFLPDAVRALSYFSLGSVSRRKRRRYVFRGGWNSPVWSGYVRLSLGDMRVRYGKTNRTR